MTKYMLIMGVLGCRPEPGPPPDYAQLEEAVSNQAIPQGPDPYQEGVPRFSFGLFYEGGSSESAPIDDATRFWWIWDEVLGETFEQVASNDVVEGLQSDVITVTDLGFWGGGIEWLSGADLSEWTTLHISLKSFDGPMASTAVGLGDLVSDGGSVDYAFLPAADYGFVTDGRWHHVSIPIADFVALGVQLDDPSLPFALRGEDTPPGTQLWVDNLYLSKGEM